jgi:hypothetical protein
LTSAAGAVHASIESKRSANAPPPAAAAPLAPAVQPAGPGAQDPGMLRVFSRVPLELRIAGQRVGGSDEPQVILPPGRYDIELVNADYNYRETMTVDVRPGKITSRTIALPKGSVRVDTEEGAEVWIEGRRAGTAPFDAVEVPIGTREVVVRHPDLGERRAAVEVRYGEVAEVSVNLREAELPPDAFAWPKGRRVP